jgi:hypothetical protein
MTKSIAYSPTRTLRTLRCLAPAALLILLLSSGANWKMG